MSYKEQDSKCTTANHPSGQTQTPFGPVAVGGLGRIEGAEIDPVVRAFRCRRNELQANIQQRRTELNIIESILSALGHI